VCGAHLDLSISSFNRRRPKPLHWTLHEVASFDFADAIHKASLVRFLHHKEHVWRH